MFMCNIVMLHTCLKLLLFAQPMFKTILFQTPACCQNNIYSMTWGTFSHTLWACRYIIIITILLCTKVPFLPRKRWLDSAVRWICICVGKSYSLTKIKSWGTLSIVEYLAKPAVTWGGELFPRAIIGFILELREF